MKKIDLGELKTAAQIGNDLSGGLGIPHVVRVKADVLLALLARLEDLESIALRAVQRWDHHHTHETEHDEGEREEARRALEVIERGTLLP